MDFPARGNWFEWYRYKFIDYLEVDNDNYRLESIAQNLPVGQHQIKFTATDPRLNEEITYPDWHDRLRVSYTATLWIIAPRQHLSVFHLSLMHHGSLMATKPDTDLYGEGELLPWIEPICNRSMGNLSKLYLR